VDAGSQHDPDPNEPCLSPDSPGSAPNRWFERLDVTDIVMETTDPFP
jgi:hypothetical protein